MMMIEENNLQIAELMEKWLRMRVLSRDHHHRHH